MYIQLEKQYAVAKPKTNNITIEFNIEEFIKDNCININNEEDLRITIQDWIDYECKEIYYDQQDWDDDIIDDNFEETNLILNMEELVKELSHLITPVKTLSCCDRARNGYNNYCPTCGTELTY